MSLPNLLGKRWHDGGCDRDQLNQQMLKIIRRASNYSEFFLKMERWEDQGIEVILAQIQQQILASDEYLKSSPAQILESIIVEQGKQYIAQRDGGALSRLGKLVERAENAGVVNRDEICEEFLVPLVSPEISVILHEHQLIDLPRQLDFDWKISPDSVQQFIGRYVELAVGGGDGGEGGAGVTCQLLTRLLVGVAYNAGGRQSDLRQKRAKLLLDKMVTKVLDSALVGGEMELSWLGSLGENSPPNIIAEFALDALSLIVRHNPGVKMSQAVKSHQDWIPSRSKNKSLLTLCKRVLLLADDESGEQVSNLVMRIVTRCEVSWEVLLTVVSLVLLHHQNSHHGLQQRIQTLVLDSLEKRDSESFIGGLLIARHACQTGGSLFPSYPAWCSTMFGPGSSVSESLQGLQYLYEIFTSLVPSDPQYALRAQISLPLHHQRQVRQVQEDYKHLARTALLDSGCQQEEYSLPATVSQADRDMGKGMIMKFLETGKIPKEIFDASMFRKVYFTSQLLPGIMTASLMVEKEVIAQKGLIEQLNAKGKIPSGLYKSFVSGQLASSLLAEATNDPDPGSDVSIENLREQVEILKNLPLELEAEVATIEKRVRHIVGCLLPNNLDSSLTLDAIMGAAAASRVDVVAVGTILESALASVFEENHCEFLLQLILNTRHLALDVMGRVLFPSERPVTQLVFSRAVLIDSLTVKGVEKKMALKQILFSAEHSITCPVHFQRLAEMAVKLIENDPSVIPPVSWQRAIQLYHIRQGQAAKKHVTKEDLLSMLRIQINIDSDKTGEECSILKRLLSCPEVSPTERIECVLKCCLGSTENLTHERKSRLIKSIDGGKGEDWLSTALNLTSEAVDETCRAETASQILELFLLTSLPEIEVMNARSRADLTQLAEESRRPGDLCQPAVACQVLATCLPVSSLTGSCRLSLARHTSLHQIPANFSSQELETEFAGVFSWSRQEPRSETDIGLALQFGIVLLSELYIKGANFLRPTSEESKEEELEEWRTVLERMKQLIQECKFGQVWEDQILLPPSRWLGKVLSPQFTRAAKFVMIVVFTVHLDCNERVFSKLFIYFSQLLQDNELDMIEKGFLSTILLNRLGSPKYPQILSHLPQSSSLHPHIRDILSFALPE